ncbi:MAG TPA: MEDS domain-containing protein [Burkholderiales bacterium]|nr:MEDS domain-containing protein [Burkholderiales bacterium]
MDLYPHGALRLLDAERTLVSLMREGMPQWPAFEALCGRAIAELRLRYPGVRACGEMVDILWQRERREAALMLEQYWNELARARPFALFCAYRIDPLRGEAYGAGLDRLCRAHTHLVPARDYGELNRAVDEAARRVLEPALAQMLASLSASHRPGTEMPAGQAMLFWLKQNMPRTAEKVLAEVRAKLA